MTDGARSILSVLAKEKYIPFVLCSHCCSFSSFEHAQSIINDLPTIQLMGLLSELPASPGQPGLTELYCQKAT